MLVIRIKIDFFICMKIVMRRVFFIRDINKVKICIVVVSWLGFFVMV